MIKPVLIAGAARTGIGAFGGQFAQVPATALGSAAVRASLQRAGVKAEEIDEVIFGNVISAGLGQNVARQVSIGAGIPNHVGATSINKVCGSGLKAIMLAAQAVQCGDANVVVAGGTENMSRAPYVLDKARSGYRLGHGQLLDTMISDGLWDVYNQLHTGQCGDRVASRCELSRQQQDDFAVASFQRAIDATARGVFTREITPVEAPAGKTTVMVSDDENLKKFNEEKLRKLPPAFEKTGTVTAANSSSINDGAASAVILSEEAAKRTGANVVAKIIGYSTHAQEPEWFGLAPIGAISNLMKKLSWTVGDVDLFEINEAFACVPLAAMKALGLPHEKMNVLGGAVALGHPLGCSGTRTLVTLLSALKDKNARRGIVSLCIGGGEAVAMAVELI